MMPSRVSERPYQRRVRSVARRIAVGYKGCALLFFNCVILYLTINLLLGIALRVHDAFAAPDVVTKRYGEETLAQAYPDMAPPERQAMLSEHYRPYVYSDFTHFQERPMSGSYVNVTEAGYRHSTAQGPWPPIPENFNVFVFGGSTTFGVGLPDHQTLPSCLQAALSRHVPRRVCLYNFGVGFYYSTQERLAFEKLVFDEHAPDVVFFIDGINEGTHLANRPTHSRDMAALFEQFAGSSKFPTLRKSYGADAADLLFDRLPVGRVTRHFMPVLRPQGGERQSEQQWDGRTSADRVCQTYFTNKFLIEQLCARLHITPVFVWQPSPAYKYDLTYHPFAPPASEPAPLRYHYEIMREYYPVMRELSGKRGEDNLIWCADRQENRKECLYCDRYHYTAEFCKDLAEYIGQQCVERKLLEHPLRSNE